MSLLPDISYHGWFGIQWVAAKQFLCGFCGRNVTSEKGWNLCDHPDGSGGTVGMIRVCPSCNGPNFFTDHFRAPTLALGRSVEHVPDEVASLYDEARTCTGSNCHTAAVLCCRKLLMHIAVAQGADGGLKFIEYVNHLVENGYVPPNGKGWVDHIRERGNEANHEIVMMSRKHSEDLLTFIEMLLRFIYEFPAKITPPASSEQSAD